MFTFTQLTDKEAVQRPMTKGSECAYSGGGRRRGRRHRRRSWYFPLFPPRQHHGGWNDRYRGDTERTNGREQRGGASDFFRCPTFRCGGGNSGFSHPSQGQTLLFMQAGLEQTPGTLYRQATSHAQRSLVITGFGSMAPPFSCKYPHRSAFCMEACD